MLLVEEVARRREVNEGSGLKYPAVNVQEEELNVGEERVRRMVRIAGSSVEESGCRRGVSCEMGYTTVFVLEEVLGGKEGGTLMSWLRMDEERVMYFLGSASGEGAGLEDGHSRM